MTGPNAAINVDAVVEELTTIEARREVLLSQLREANAATGAVLAAYAGRTDAPAETHAPRAPRALISDEALVSGLTAIRAGRGKEVADNVVRALKRKGWVESSGRGRGAVLEATASAPGADAE